MTVGRESLSVMGRQIRIPLRRMLPYLDVTPHQSDQKRAVIFATNSLHDIKILQNLEQLQQTEPLPQGNRIVNSLPFVSALVQFYQQKRNDIHQLLHFWQGTFDSTPSDIFFSDEFRDDRFSQYLRANSVNSRTFPFVSSLFASIESKPVQPIESQNLDDNQLLSLNMRQVFPILPPPWGFQSSLTLQHLNNSFSNSSAISLAERGTELGFFSNFVQDLALNPGLKTITRFTHSIPNALVAFSSTHSNRLTV